MPSATDELRGEMQKMFGNEVDDFGPTKFLEDRGYTLNEEWNWVKPSPDHIPLADELICIYFLMQEWDFGGIAA